MKKLLAVGIILLLVGVSIPSTGRVLEQSSTIFSDGITLYVGGSGPGNYTKIQDAIDDASDGDTVFVYNGIYVECLYVDISINLTGENKNTTAIYGDWYSSSVVHVSADWVNISEFTIRYEYEEYSYGITLDSSNNNVSYNIIADNWCGLYLLDTSSSNTITDNVINGNYNLYGIWLSNSNNDNIIKNNSFSHNWVALSLSDSSNNIITDNYFWNNDHDIILEYHCMNNIISRNTLKDPQCHACIGIGSSSNSNIIIDNTIKMNSDWGYGIDIRNCKDNIVIGNLVSDCGVGIRLIDTIDNKILCNNIKYCEWYGLAVGDFPPPVNKEFDIHYRYSKCNNINDYKIPNNYYGMCHFMSGNDNTIHHNNFINNDQNAYDECSNKWDNGYPSGGNFWDDYNGTDDDGDGIGDTPYPILGGDNEDRYPLMEPWVWEDELFPIAKFTWTPTLPDPGETIIFNASESIDYDGNISLYEWDWDNDGEYETLKTTPTATHSWSNDGYYPVTTRVTDNDNLTDSKTKTVRVGNYPPYKPSNPIPPDGATNILPGCLEWTGGDPDGDTVVYDVYFGTKSPPPLLACNISQTIFCSPGDLLFNTTYYWQIVAWDEHGAFTEGPIWSFTIRDNNPPDNPIIEGQKIFEVVQGGESTYTFYSIDPEGDNIIYEIKWGDGIIDYLGPFESGLKVSIDRSIPFMRGTYILFKIRARDFFGEKSNWTTLTVYVVEVKPTFLLGFIENIEQEDNFSIVTVKFLLTARFIPFDIRFLSSGKNIVISNKYIGFVGSFYMVGRFKTDFD